VEISDNNLEIASKGKWELIRLAWKEHGLTVLAEVARKDRQSSRENLLWDLDGCLGAGAHKIIIKAAELIQAGTECFTDGLIDSLHAAVPPRKLIWELPGPWIEGVQSHQIYSWVKQPISALGPEVNLANVVPEMAVELESLLTGLGVVLRKDDELHGKGDLYV
jgi:phosphosulfolactate synthase (CoM biosynthesis protein A)